MQTCVQHGFISCHIILWLDDLFSHKSQLKQKCLSCQVMPSERWRKSDMVTWSHIISFRILSHISRHIMAYPLTIDEIKSLDSDIPWKVERWVPSFSCSSEIPTPFLWNRVWVLVRTMFIMYIKNTLWHSPKCTVYVCFLWSYLQKKDKRQFSWEPCRKVLRHQNMVKSGAPRTPRCESYSEPEIVQFPPCSMVVNWARLIYGLPKSLCSGGAVLKTSSHQSCPNRFVT